MKLFKNIAMTFVIGMIAAVLLMLIVNALPKKRMITNLKETVPIMEVEGDYPYIITGYLSSRLDNFTDAIMLLTSVHKEDTGLIDRAMNTYRVSYPNERPSTSLVKYGKGEEGYSVKEYARYWHGYQVVLKPLLLFFNYQEIRFLNMYAQLALISVVVVQLIQKKMWLYLPPYFMTVISLVPFTVASSLQYSGVFYIMNIASFIVIRYFDKIESKKNGLLFFFILGMTTSFIDLLTYPIITLGIPLGFYLVLIKKKEQIRELIRIILYSIAWGIGYLGMWSGKWVIASVLLQKNVVKDAIDAILNRTSTQASDQVVDRWEAINKNFSIMFETPVKIIFIFLIFVMIMVLVYRMMKDKKMYIKNWQMLLIPVMPIAWYFVLANHSYIHFWFTYRSLGVLIFGILMWLCKNISDSIQK